MRGAQVKVAAAAMLAALAIAGIASAGTFSNPFTAANLRGAWCALAGCTITGNLSVNGNTTLGDAPGTDTLTVNAATTISGTETHLNNQTYSQATTVTATSGITYNYSSTGVDNCNGTCPTWYNDAWANFEGTISSDGAIYSGGALSATRGNISIGASNEVDWYQNTVLRAGSNGTLSIRNNAETFAVGITATADGAGTIKNKALTGWATIDLGIIGLQAYTCATLPVTSTTRHIIVVSDATVADKPALCIEDSTGWLLPTGAGTACCP